ncbi:MAG: class I SAM-dependent methyltransferase [Sandaracinus sp.]
MVSYGERPGLSPVVASLAAAGLIKREHSILDIGCGTGTDVLALARWGAARVVGIDTDGDLIGAAKRRAKGWGADRTVSFTHASISAANAPIPHASFDVVIDTLCRNNVPKSQLGAYSKNCWAALRPRGLIIIQERLHSGDNWRVTPRPLVSLRPYFDMGPSILTHIPEFVWISNRKRRTWATVAVHVGVRRSR